MLEEMIPFPREDTTPPVTKMNLGVFICQVRSKNGHKFTDFSLTLSLSIRFIFPGLKCRGNLLVFCKKVRKKFVSSKIVYTFAVPFGNERDFYGPDRKAGVSFLKYFSEFKEGDGRGPERPSGREDRRASLTQKSGK